MFDFIKENKEKKEAREFEDRSNNLQREQSVLDATKDDSYFSQVQSERSDLIHWQQQLENEIEEIKYSLLGYTLTENGWEKSQHSQQLVNAKGTSFIINIEIKPRVHRNFMMTNLKDEIINRILFDIDCNLIILFGDKYKEFEIDPLNLTSIKDLIVHNVEATLYRAWNNGERSHLNTINKRVETVNNQVQQEKKGIFGGLV